MLLRKNFILAFPACCPLLGALFLKALTRAAGCALALELCLLATAMSIRAARDAEQE
jgi:hypothetical protein